MQHHTAISRCVQLPRPPTGLIRGTRGLSSSQGIWKHLKLPTRQPRALTARSHTGWSSAPILPGNQQVPCGCSRPIGRQPGRDMVQVHRAAKCQEDQHHSTHPPHLNWLSVKPRRSGVSSSDCMMPKQSLPVADAVTDGGELGDCLYPGFWTNSCQALEHSQCSSTAAPVASG